MLDTFNNEIRRLANLVAYEQPTGEASPMMVTAAKMYLAWDGEMPEPVIRTAPETASGEISAR
jgi:hypothetical protein